MKSRNVIWGRGVFIITLCALMIGCKGSTANNSSTSAFAVAKFLYSKSNNDPILLYGGAANNFFFTASDYSLDPETGDPILRRRVLRKTNGKKGNATTLKDFKAEGITLQHIYHNLVGGKKLYNVFDENNPVSNKLLSSTPDGKNIQEVYKFESAPREFVTILDSSDRPEFNIVLNEEMLFFTLTVKWNEPEPEGLHKSSAEDLWMAIMQNLVNQAESRLELWKTDGTTTGTVKVSDIPLINFTDVEAGGNTSSAFAANLIFLNPLTIFKSDTEVYFSFNAGEDGSELWKTDGTTSGTVKTGLSVELAPHTNRTETNAKGIKNIKWHEGRIYFSYVDYSDADSRRELWSYDGTNLSLVNDIAQSPTGGANPWSLYHRYGWHP